MNLAHLWQEASRRQRIALMAVVLWLMYLLVGYFLVSPFLRLQTQQVLTELTGRDVRLERLIFNPLALSVSLQNLAVPDDDGKDLFAVTELYVNFETSSLLRWSWHFDRISVFQPRVRAVQTGENSFNFDDIVARLTAHDAEPEVPELQVSTIIPRVSFREFLLVQGDFRFRDEARDQPDELVLAPLSFQVNDFSTRGDGQGNNRFEFVVTGPAGGRLDWTGSLALDPFVAGGRIALSGLDLTPFTEFFSHQVQFRVPSANLDVATDYHLEMHETGQIRLSEGALRLSGLTIRDPDLDDPVAQLASVVIAGAEIDSGARQVVIDQLSINEARLDVRLREHGLHLEQLFTPVEQSSAVSASMDAELSPELNIEPAAQDTRLSLESTRQDQVASELWGIRLNSVLIDETSVRLIDETLPESAQLLLAPLRMEVSNLALNSADRFQFSATSGVAQSGTVTVVGQGTLEPLDIAIALQLEALPLAALEPWVQPLADVRVATGTLSAQLDIQHRKQVSPAGNSEPSENTLLHGALQINQVLVREAQGTDLLSWDALDVTGIALSLAEQSLHIDHFNLANLSAQHLVTAQGLDPLQRISRQRSQAPGSHQDTAQQDDWRITVDKVQLKNGELVHIDRSLSPTFRFGLHQVDGEVRQLDSSGSRAAQVAVSARIDGVNPLAVNGQIRLKPDHPGIDLSVAMGGYDMNSLTPFTGRYLGYVVSSGQLSVDSRIALNGTMLDSDSRVRAASFFLGDSVPSEEALRAPIKLGLAVLRDRNDLIDLPIRAHGDLSDPSVSASGIILRTLTNIMVRAATSPFSVLAAMAGSGELDHIDFISGDSVPTEDGRAQMATLAQLLGERPALIMNLAGSAQDADRLPLAQHELGLEITGGSWQGLDSALSDSGFRRRVQGRYRELTGERAETLLGERVINDRELREQEITRRAFIALSERDAEAMPVSRLDELAALRAQHSKALLVDEFGLDGERLLIVSSRLAGQDALSGVILELGAN